MAAASCLLTANLSNAGAFFLDEHDGGEVEGIAAFFIPTLGKKYSQPGKKNCILYKPFLEPEAKDWICKMQLLHFRIDKIAFDKSIS